ncbi:phosphatidylinositol alpha-mannosyltransferase [Kribbella sp. VKM Ac-2569]|uniref:glycosyltransferase family 4 protein n=1 Tax=Kribbella sp. VKM Ac-2569 TaxID=2512220 RepID=UPI00102C19B9|nr:glycosyltransferase family 4 protein [Kribbella sp. VKM Ac-2569]RZT17572.1 phosphatidylinositol alpha-mannosyltransferase [Kribbella sp. VKM Ac-2569]
MRIGVVCPYSLGTPGGVQNHVRDLAEALLSLGHGVSVLAPVDESSDSAIPPYVVSSGRAVGVPYNGSVARVTFGPRTAARVKSWLADGNFDVVHVHEPTTPSASIIALWSADGPFVATFHTWQVRSRAMSVASSLLRPALEKIDARIAVSENARSMMVQHIGGEAVVIPNGLYTARFKGSPRPEWMGEDGTISFLGRLDEPRKGLGVLLDAVPALIAERPRLKILVAGSGQADEALPPRYQDNVLFLGAIDDEARADMLAGSDVYVAPHLGGESFGIVLLEAMAAGAPVLASDLPAFRHVLEGGQLGELFEPGNAGELAARALRLLRRPDEREQLRAVGLAGVPKYDWSVLLPELLSVYELVARR